MKAMVKECKISIGSGGDASLKGSAEKLAAEMKSGGDLYASDFKVKDARVKLSGGSDAQLHVTGELMVSASGGGQVHVSGDPVIDADLSGGSKVHKK